MTNWLIALLIARLFGGNAFADCVPSPDTPASVTEYFKRFQEAVAGTVLCHGRRRPPKPPRNPRNSIRKPMRTCQNRPRLSAGATMLSYLLNTSLFQTRSILPPMAYGLATLNFARRISSFSLAIRERAIDSNKPRGFAHK